MAMIYLDCYYECMHISFLIKIIDKSKNLINIIIHFMKI